MTFLSGIQLLCFVCYKRCLSGILFMWYPVFNSLTSGFKFVLELQNYSTLSVQTNSVNISLLKLARHNKWLPQHKMIWIFLCKSVNNSNIRQHHNIITILLCSCSSKYIHKHCHLNEIAKAECFRTFLQGGYVLWLRILKCNLVLHILYEEWSLINFTF